MLLSASAAACATAGTAPAAAERTEAEPVVASYTTEQADRGQRVFSTVCAVCHGRNDFRGPIFELTWMQEPVATLFEHVSTEMPQDEPGSLSAEQYAAVVAYILQLNGRPAGSRELPDNLEELEGMTW